jgi:hypothetical protein
LDRPAPSAAWRAGAWPWPAPEHVAEDEVVDLARLDAGLLDRGLDRDGAQLRALMES